MDQIIIVSGSTNIGRPRHLGIIPYSYHNGSLKFLLGMEKESYDKDSNGNWVLWSGSHSWRFFGGKPEENDKNYIYTACRECYEESMGFLGTKNELYNRITSNGTRRAVAIEHEKGIFFPLYITYDPNLPKMYSRVKDYLNACLREHEVPVYEYKEKVIPTCPHGYLEKEEISWAARDEILSAHKNKEAIFDDFFIRFVKSKLWDNKLFPA